MPKLQPLGHVSVSDEGVVLLIVSFVLSDTSNNQDRLSISRHMLGTNAATLLLSTPQARSEPSAVWSAPLQFFLTVL